MGEATIRMWGLKILTADPASMEVLAYRTEGEALEVAESLRRAWVSLNAGKVFNLAPMIVRMAALFAMDPDAPTRREALDRMLAEPDLIPAPEPLWTGVDSDGTMVTVDLSKVSKWCVELVQRKAVGVAGPVSAH